ncbi:hydrogenase expression/formation protein HypE [Clostridium sp. A1-XYC3]|uniref:Hydrogenase expression/formation protein HypE n=1 Tax=Clostridium tanneri TaxID=3037988 RepID=A0ABU4JYC8_9CLOT|nr:hydrogenase expression/formation protein HypE [Clostridium sp. A1-XYC3]MDW8803112.1 hydrogenase expression/formation protein HypE [Clostridium sp. A1-XYC3]
MSDVIKLAHGDGGKFTNELIKNLFYRHFRNRKLEEGIDAATFSVNEGRMAFTTDSFVVKPIFFYGGDIGKLAVCGSINDLAVSGAKPLYLSASFIIEEGFPIDKLEAIVRSMGDTCTRAGVNIITGDTKVVEKGSVDGIFINTSGVGIIESNYKMKTIESGDQIIVTGTIGEHGTAIAIQRYDIKVKGNFKSDCNPLNGITENIQDLYPYIKIMKDPTRGGLVTILNELAELAGLGVRLIEEKIPVSREVKAMNEMLGLDPLYMACEGRMVLVVNKLYAEKVLNRIRSLEGCKDANIIGNFDQEASLKVYIENYLGGKRILNTLEGAMLPRIC